MLKSLDVLIGLTVVLLALSLAVTVITQGVTAMVNSRGKHLRRGLIDLLQQLDPALTATLSKTIATKLLTHPLVSGASTMLPQIRPRLGNVVHREEFTKLLMVIASGSATEVEDEAEKAAKAALVRALANNGVEKPEEMLKNIRSLAMQLERSAPELSHMARQNMAILQAAESDFVAKVNNWFDQTMDRTSQRFTASTRAITFAGAFIVAFGLQVDIVALVNRLAVDDELRATFVQQAGVMVADPKLQATVQPAQDPAQNATPVDPAPNATRAAASDYQAFLNQYGVITLPSGWKLENLNLGMLLTAFLLSFGAPFWYSTLSKLLQLRSVLASKDDAQRAERQSRDKPAQASTAPGAEARPAAQSLAGERGDTSAIG